MKAEVEYTAVVSVTVDLKTGEVGSVDVRAPSDEDETPAEVGVSLESETDQPDEVFDRARQLVDAAAPFELREVSAGVLEQPALITATRATMARAASGPSVLLRFSPCVW